METHVTCLASESLEIANPEVNRPMGQDDSLETLPNSGASSSSNVSLQLSSKTSQKSLQENNIDTKLDKYAIEIDEAELKCSLSRTNEVSLIITESTTSNSVSKVSSSSEDAVERMGQIGLIPQEVPQNEENKEATISQLLCTTDSAFIIQKDQGDGCNDSGATGDIIPEGSDHMKQNFIEVPHIKENYECKQLPNTKDSESLEQNSSDGSEVCNILVTEEESSSKLKDNITNDSKDSSAMESNEEEYIDAVETNDDEAKNEKSLGGSQGSFIGTTDSTASEHCHDTLPHKDASETNDDSGRSENLSQASHEDLFETDKSNAVEQIGDAMGKNEPKYYDALETNDDIVRNEKLSEALQQNLPETYEKSSSFPDSGDSETLNTLVDPNCVNVNVINDGIRTNENGDCEKTKCSEKVNTFRLESDEGSLSIVNVREEPSVAVNVKLNEAVIKRSIESDRNVSGSSTSYEPSIKMKEDIKTEIYTETILQGEDYNAGSNNHNGLSGDSTNHTNKFVKAKLKARKKLLVKKNIIRRKVNPKAEDLLHKNENLLRSALWKEPDGSRSDCQFMMRNVVNTTKESTPNRMSLEDSDEMLPIQAEVVMSDASDEEECVNKYLNSFVKCTSFDSTLEIAPPILPPSSMGSLATWQLDKAFLPKFVPFIEPPTWLRLTIPADGYPCLSCGDVFFIETSLAQHKERRSAWISFHCGPCDTRLTFYNRCSFKDHLREHLANGEQVTSDSAIVKTLPFHLSKLLQPLMISFPDTLKPTKQKSLKMKEGLVSTSDLCSLNRLESNGHPPKDKIVEPDLQTKLSPPSELIFPSKRNVCCYLCEKVFNNVRELMNHMKTNQNYSDQRVECRKCHLVLPSVCAAKAHILTHPPANTNNISVCPECGSKCEGPRDFVHHLNTCGHQFRRSGVLCTQCQVCFFKFSDDFLLHWIKDHCTKSYECVVCSQTFESIVFHKQCSIPGQEVMATFKCLLACPLCPCLIQLHAQDEKDAVVKVKTHLCGSHTQIMKRVYYVYKSKFCANAFRSKDELRAHHDREHRRDNHYRSKSCSLYNEVLGYQQQYFSGQEPRNAFVTLPFTLSAEELKEAKSRDVPTVTSVIDKTLFPDGPLTLDQVMRVSKLEKEASSKLSCETQTLASVGKKENLKPSICYRCGYSYLNSKDFRKHSKNCEGAIAERVCQVCGVTAVGEEFARHCLSHIENGHIICIYCNGTSFFSHRTLQQHFDFHIHEQFVYPVTCAFCSLLLPDAHTALNHVKEEHDPLHSLKNVDVECEQCGRKFHGERGLSVHMLRCGNSVSSPPNLGRYCKVCKKGLTPEMFGKHIIAHLEEGLLVCGLCDGLSLPSSMTLLHHLEEHAQTLAYPWTCPLCTTELMDHLSSQTHMKADHGFGNITCPDCEMNYNFTFQLDRHIGIVHKACLYAKRRYICWICRAYDHVKKETLMNHFRTNHGLTPEEVDEKVMIRTRGLGTMPSSQFLPTKPLGCKENGTPPSSRRYSEKSKGFKNSKINDSLVIVFPKLEVTDISQHEFKSEPESLPITDGKDSLTIKLGKLLANDCDSVDVDGKLKHKAKVLVKRLSNNVIFDQKIVNAEKRGFSNKRKRKIIPDHVEKDTKRQKLKRPKAFRCRMCTFCTNSRRKYDHHFNRHKMEIEDFVCSECKQSFVSELSLKRHMFFEHRIKSKVPSISARWFTRNYSSSEIKLKSSKDGKNRHKKKFTKRNRYSKKRKVRGPPLGGGCSPKPVEGECHLQVERDGEKRISETQCSVCFKEFTTPIKLYSHLRTHGMAFLKVGRSKRELVTQETPVVNETTQNCQLGL